MKSHLTTVNVSKLRKESGYAGMMDCKNALEACDSYEEARGYLKGLRNIITTTDFNRVEIISNQLGREYTKYCKGTKLSIQDSVKTLKIFIEEEE